jgi:hypothetical protein
MMNYKGFGRKHKCLIEVLSQHLPGGKSQKTTLWIVCWLRFQPGTSLNTSLHGDCYISVPDVCIVMVGS